MEPKVIFVLGGPGVGKGTACSIAVSKNPSLVHLSAGELLREARASGSEHGQLIQSCIDEGKLVPAWITVALLRNAMTENGWADKQFLIDGFPRNFDNLNTWAENMADTQVQYCVFLDAPSEVLIQRIAQRGGERSDDDPSIIQKRLDTYRNETLPIIQQYEESGKLRRIDATGGIEEVSQAFLDLF